MYYINRIKQKWQCVERQQCASLTAKQAALLIITRYTYNVF